MPELIKLKWTPTAAEGLPRRDRQGCDYEAYVPDPLVGRTIAIDGASAADVADAERAVSRLESAAHGLADSEAIAHLLLRAEAVASSKIEGLQVGGRRLLKAQLMQALGRTATDVTAQEILNNIEAVAAALEEQEPGRPITLERLLDVQARLLHATGLEKQAGRLREEQNWIGGSSYNPCSAEFVPPPQGRVPELMADLCHFASQDALPALVQAALAHAQFETIHPFLDGNGRVGRLLITLLLCSEGVLSRPLLYLSLHFKRNRDSYYEHLQRVRTDGAWEDWLRFFLEGVIEVAESTTLTTQRVVAMVEKDRQKIHTFGRGAATAHRLHDLATRSVVIGASSSAERLELTGPPVYAAIQRLETAGILREATGRQRGKLYVYDEYLTILNEGTEPL
jgi:Fic family protein